MKGFLILMILSNSKIMPSLKEILKNAGSDEKTGVLVHLKEKPDYERIKDLNLKDYIEFLKRFSEKAPENLSPRECHNCGEIKFCVTNMGVFDECCYPKGSSSHLYYGGFAIGTKYPYVIDRYYESNSSTDDDWIPVDGVYMYEPYPPFCEYSLAVYNDSGGEEVKNIVCIQKGYTFSDSSADDFIILEFILKNNGFQDIESLYAGIFLDWDIGYYTNNTGGVDTSRNLVYQTDLNIYMGSAILYPYREDPRIANLSMINNPAYVYPYGGLPDSIEMKFLNGIYSIPSADSPDDWSTCVSAGPFGIQIGDSIKVALVISGGNSLAELQKHVDTAYARYYTFGIKKRKSSYKEDIKIFPAVSRGKIYLFIPLLNKKVNIGITDVTGRTVRKFSFIPIESHLKEINISELPQGIYILRIDTPYFRKKKKIVILK